MRGLRRFSLLLLPSIVLAWSCASVPEAPTSDVDPNMPAPGPRNSASPAPTGKPIEAPDPEPEPVSDAGTDTSTTVPTRPVFPSDTPRAGRGDVVVTEVMFDPSGPEPANEWFEVRNVRSSARSLAGLALKDGAGRTHAIAGTVGELGIAANDYVVIARDRATAIASGVPAEAVVYEYGAKLASSEGIQLSNGASGLIALFDGATEVTSVAYGSYAFVDVEGRSCQADANGKWSLAPATPGAPTR